MRTYAPNPNFTEIRRSIKAYHSMGLAVESSPLFPDFDAMTQAVIEGSVFTDRTPETDHPEICPE